MPGGTFVLEWLELNNVKQITSVSNFDTVDSVHLFTGDNKKGFFVARARKKPGFNLFNTIKHVQLNEQALVSLEKCSDVILELDVESDPGRIVLSDKNGVVMYFTWTQATYDLNGRSGIYLKCELTQGATRAVEADVGDFFKRDDVTNIGGGDDDEGESSSQQQGEDVEDVDVEGEEAPPKKKKKKVEKQGKVIEKTIMSIKHNCLKAFVESCVEFLDRNKIGKRKKKAVPLSGKRRVGAICEF